MKARPTRLMEVVQAAAGYLEGKGIEQARLQAELLAAHVLGCRRLELYLRFDTIVSEAQRAALRDAVRRVAQGAPLQHVTGTVEFMGHVFDVDPRVLIPRPETETLVEAILESPGFRERCSPRIAEAGTGSGCIAISLALAHSGARLLAVDRSPESLAVAIGNGGRHKVLDRVGFAVSDLLTCAPAAGMDMVVANLPYIRTEDCARLPANIRDHEPRMALDGGADGLDLIRRLVPQAAQALRPGGMLFLEIGWDQREAATALLGGFEGVECRRDLGGRDRVLVARQRAV